MEAALQTDEWMALDRTLGRISAAETETAKEDLLIELLPLIFEVLKDRVKEHEPLGAAFPADDGKLTITEASEKYSLTRREHTILRALLDGKENDVICDELAISVNTLKKHILNIYRKMGIRNRVQLFKMVKERE